MANNSVVTQEVLQNTLENYHENFVYPYLNGATHTGCDPVGTIKIVSGNEVPPYCLACDGTVYNIADYPDLAQFYERSQGASNFYGGDGITTFAVPNLKGEFLRGTGTNSHSNQGNGASVGVHQDATEMPSIYIDNNQQAICAQNNNTSGYNTATNQDKSIPGTTGTGRYVKFTNEWSGGTSEQRRYTSRPTNTSVLFCVVYKNNYIDLALDSFPIDITQPTDGQLLMYDATAGRWVNGGHKYSTDEHVVGTWIDGKPIYEKTITIQLGTLTTDKVAVNEIYSFSTLSLNNIESMWLVESHTSTGTSGNITWGSNTPEYFIRTNINTSAQQVEVQTNRITLSGQSIIATVRYTKTTDTV